MKHFTLSLLALAVLSAPSVSAQKVLPAHQTEYIYQDGDWMQGGEYTFTYDANGNVIQQDYNDGSTISRITNEWSAEGLNTLQIEQTSEDNGATFTNSTKRVQTYDPLYPKLITLTKDRYQWTNDQWVATGDAFRRNVVRDADNNVTSLTVSVPYNGGWDETQRYTNTVNPVTKQITSFKFEELGYSEDNTGFSWQTSQYLRNLVWKETNGQLVGGFDDWMSLGNKLASGTISEINGTDTTDLGTVTITYDENGGYVETMAYTDELSKVVTKYTVDDAYGSNTLDETDYMDTDGDGQLTPRDVVMHMQQIQRYDAKGNIIEEKMVGTNEETGEMEQQAGTLYNITYSTEYPDAQAEVIISEWNADSMAYEPTMRITTDQFATVTNAIRNVSANRNQPDRIYNIQGAAVSGSLESAPHGLYIVTRNGKTYKVMK